MVEERIRRKGNGKGGRVSCDGGLIVLDTSKEWGTKCK